MYVLLWELYLPRQVTSGAEPVLTQADCDCVRMVCGVMATGMDMNGRP